MENLLKTKRLEKRLTLEQVGEAVGVGKSTVRKWENGMIENMGRDKIVALSKALDISPLDILGIEKTQESTTKQILDNVFSKLNEPRQEKVVNYAKTELDNQNKVTSISEYQAEKEYPYYDDAVSAGTGQFIGTSQRDTVSLPVDIDADYAIREISRIKNEMKPNKSNISLRMKIADLYYKYKAYTKRLIN